MEDIINREYQIVNTEFPIATDGTLGRDFLLNIWKNRL